jgi:hypothetical protein
MNLAKDHLLLRLGAALVGLDIAEMWEIYTQLSGVSASCLGFRISYSYKMTSYPG